MGTPGQTVWGVCSQEQYRHVGGNLPLHPGPPDHGRALPHGGRARNPLRTRVPRTRTRLHRLALHSYTGGGGEGNMSSGAGEEVRDEDSHVQGDYWLREGRVQGDRGVQASSASQEGGQPSRIRIHQVREGEEGDLQAEADCRGEVEGPRAVSSGAKEGLRDEDSQGSQAGL